LVLGHGLRLFGSVGRGLEVIDAFRRRTPGPGFRPAAGPPLRPAQASFPDRVPGPGGVRTV
jgi:hypothetical protein